MRHERWIGGAVATTVVGATLLFAAPALAAPTEDTAEPGVTVLYDARWSDKCLPGKLRALREHAPEALIADLKETRALGPGEERRAALHDIRERARAGEYGDKAEWFADTRLHRWVEAWRAAPQEFKDDLRALRDVEAGEERRTAAEELLNQAAAGEYGAGVQERAQKVQECRAAK